MLTLHVLVVLLLCGPSSIGRLVHNTGLASLCAFGSLTMCRIPITWFNLLCTLSKFILNFCRILNSSLHIRGIIHKFQSSIIIHILTIHILGCPQYLE